MGLFLSTAGSQQVHLLILSEIFMHHLAKDLACELVHFRTGALKGLPEFWRRSRFRLNKFGRFRHFEVSKMVDTNMLPRLNRNDALKK